MSTLDRLTEGERERLFVQRLRSGAIPSEQLDQAVPPFFLKVQIQTTSACNAACVTCPYPDTSRTLPMGRMDAAVYSRILAQLTGRGVERVSLFLMNEPLVDPRLEDWTAQLKREVPEAKATIITNGSRLDGARAESLARAGMDEISVSVNGFDADSYERTMSGLDFARIRENLGEVAALRRQGRLGAMDVRVVALRLPGVADAADAFRRSIDLEVFLKPVTNRAGSVDVERLGAPGKGRPEPAICQRPFVKAYILWNGDLVLCNCDWQRAFVIGNVNEQPLEELWHHPRLQGQRRALAAGRLPSGTPCAGCDYPFLIDA